MPPSRAPRIGSSCPLRRTTGGPHARHLRLVQPRPQPPPPPLALLDRIFEYYSEDPLLTGTIAANIISGAGDQGLYCYLKHFFMNETDTGRSVLICTWADEQPMRELYLRPFEIAFRDSRMTVNYLDETGAMQSVVKRAGTAAMASQTCIGTQLGHTNYALLTKLLRGEWNFEGMVISDYWVWNGDNHRDLAMRTGCDTYLCMRVARTS